MLKELIREIKTLSLGDIKYIIWFLCTGIGLAFLIISVFCLIWDLPVYPVYLKIVFTCALFWVIVSIYIGIKDEF